MVVPESEVLEPAVTIQEFGDTAMTNIIIIVVCVSIACVLLGAYVAKVLADKIAEPVKVFNKVCMGVCVDCVLSIVKLE